MIRFTAELKLFPRPKPSPPRNMPQNANVWCSFNTKKQLISCRIVYLGPDEFLLDNKWYTGVVELPYGERFPPYTKYPFDEQSEPINLDEQYELNVGDRVLGVCILKEINGIVWGDFDIKHT